MTSLKGICYGNNRGMKLWTSKTVTSKDMSIEHIDKCMARNGTVEIAHVVRNGLVVARRLLKEGRRHPELIVEYIAKADHRLQSLERSLQTLIDRARKEDE